MPVAFVVPPPSYGVSDVLNLPVQDSSVGHYFGGTDKRWRTSSGLPIQQSFEIRASSARKRASKPKETPIKRRSLSAGRITQTDDWATKISRWRRQSPPKSPSSNNLYRVIVTTGLDPSAKTSAPLWLQLKGVSGKKSEKRLLVNKSKRDENGAFAFESGSKHTFKVRARDVGELESIQLHLDTADERHDWFCKEVQITDTDRKQAWVFPCQKWFSMYRADGYNSRVLTACKERPANAMTTYDIVIVTGDLPDAGTDATVYITLYDSASNTHRAKLPRTDDECFLPANSSTFQVTAKCLDEIKRIRLEHDNTGRNPLWFVDRVVVTDRRRPNVQYFASCNAWIGPSIDHPHGYQYLDCSTDPLDAGTKVGHYRVTFWTGHDELAGTSDNIRVNLGGSSGWVGEHRFKPPYKLKPGSSESFEFKGRWISTVTMVTVTREGSTSKGWLLEKVIVDDLVVDRVFEFKCNTWLSKDRGEGVLSRTFTASGASAITKKEIVPFQLRITTGNMLGAGTGARVYVILHGEKKKQRKNKKSGRISSTDDDLSISGGSEICSERIFVPGSFERGSTVLHDIKAELALCPLTQLTVGHDNSGAGPGWYLEDVVVFCPSTGLEQHFIANKWFARNEDDRLIERVIYERMALRVKRTPATLWEMTVETSNKPNATTKAKVFLQLYGSKGKSKEVMISQNGFRSSSSERMQVHMEDVGVPYKMRVWHDESGLAPGWHLSRITGVSNGVLYVFPCNKWLASDEEPYQPLRELPATGADVKIPSSVIRYKISIHTGTEPHAGTNANVFITLFGTQGDSGMRKVRKSATHIDKFERGSVDDCIFECVDLKRLTKLVAEHDGTGTLAGWFLSHIVVSVEHQPATAVTFPCNRWLASDEDDGLLRRELVPEGEVDLNQMKFSITVKTGEVTGAGTNANVHINIRGSGGRESGLIRLAKSKTHRNKFERGKIDKFSYMLSDIGEITSLTIGHDSTGFGAGWYLDYVQIEIPARGELYIFSTHRWLDKSEGDGKIEIDADITEIQYFKPSITYKITTNTADAPGAGTTANVGCVIYGLHGKTEAFALTKSSSDFNAGAQTAFTVTGDDVGQISKVRIWHDNYGESPGWKLQNMTIVRNRSFAIERSSKEQLRKRNIAASFAYDSSSIDITRHADTNYYFACRRWLALDQDDNEIVRELPPCYKRTDKSIEPRALRKYKIAFRTGWSQESIASSDLKVYVILYGPKGDTGERLLRNKEGTPKAFNKPGGEDIFEIEAVNLGDVHKLIVMISGGNWLCNEAIVNEGNTTLRMPCQQLLSSKSEDGQMHRSLAPIPSEVISERIPKDLMKSPGCYRQQIGLEMKSVKTTYYVSITTSKKALSSSASAYIELIGQLERSPKFYLRKSLTYVSSFEVGHTDVFELEASHLGPLVKMVLGHNGESFGWYVQKVEIEVRSEGYKLVFPCGRWFDRKQEDGAIERELLPLATLTELFPKMVPYDITVVTSNRPNAGTDADVFIELYGVMGSTGQMSLVPSTQRRKSYFEAGSRDHFILELADVGEMITKLRIGHDGTGMGSGWHLEQVVIRKLASMKTSRTFTFECGQWLARSEGDRSIIRELLPEDVIQEKVDATTGIVRQKVKHESLEKKDYLVRVFTGDMTGAGTDANVFLTLYGERGDSGERQLKHSNTNINKFERNDVDEFCITAANLGLLIKCLIRHDNGGVFGAAWYLNKIEVSDGDETTVFYCERWLSKKHDDKKIERMLFAKNYNEGAQITTLDGKVVGMEKDPSLSRTRKIGMPTFDVPTVPYVIKLVTGKEKEMGTNANISITVFGKEGASTKRLPLRFLDKTKQFRPRSVETFSIDAPDVGEIERIEISSDGVLKEQAWFLEEVEIDQPLSGRNYLFVCERWFSKDKDDGLLTRSISIADAQTATYKPKSRYEVEVTTGDVEHAGTDCQIFIQLFGLGGTSLVHLFEKCEVQFERGNINKFCMEIEDVEPLRKLRVTLQRNGHRTAWFLTSISLLNLTSKKAYKFHCEEWLGVGKKDKDWIDLPAQINDQLVVTYVSYEIDVITSDFSGSGTDANVFCILFGENGDSNTLKLKKSETYTNKFESGHTDVFKFNKILDLGVLYKLRIWHDDALFNASWHLKEVVVKQNSKLFCFPVNKWLSSTKDDKQVMREVACSNMHQHISSAESTEYEVVITTVDKRDAGIHGNVFLILCCGKNRSQSLQINNVQNREKFFSRGSTNKFNLKAKNFAKIDGIYLGHETSRNSTSRANSSWFCYDVKVTNKLNGDTFSFLINKPLQPTTSVEQASYFKCTDVKDGTFNQKLVPTKYEVNVYTGDVFGAGTDANVSLTLCGSKGTTNKQKLAKSLLFTNKFEQGQRDLFYFEFLDLGKLYKAIVEMDHSGAGAAWFLDKIEVVNLRTKEKTTFPCKKWLDKSVNETQTTFELVSR